MHNLVSITSCKSHVLLLVIDPVEELVNTFEQITYPKFDEDKKSEDDNEEDTEDECKVDVISEGFTVIDPLTPVESLNSCKGKL